MPLRRPQKTRPAAECRRTGLVWYLIYESAPQRNRPCLLQAPFVGNTEFPAALFATARDKFTAIFGGHTFAKAVLVFAGASGRLICTFH